MPSIGVAIPASTPWPDALKIAVISSQAASPGWRRLAHEAAAAGQSEGHSFPLAEPTSRP